jgi:hypothetical protein
MFIIPDLKHVVYVHIQTSNMVNDHLIDCHL